MRVKEAGIIVPGMRTEKNNLHSNAFVLIIVPACLALQAIFTSGCTTLFDETRNRRVRDASEMQILQQDVASLKEKIRSIESANERLVLEMEAVKVSSAKDIVDIRNAMGAENEKSKQDIKQDLASTLSKQIEAIMRSQYQSPPVSRSGSRTERGGEHIIEAGQTLTHIARIYGISVDALMKANNITDANSIRKGDKLVIPK